ncbi:SLC13 family permease [Rariglobus hedericola]|uniref:SLC13 family permease n=1 Tax=Rariglobus hedericola TaxID=2597822 RepID=A0A556QN52_9BACT|nr:SLC13 family permease [Rariglobus hedericola]TSJ78063.1 SLC13 family permease [Rariglobus hedericola]
MNRDLMLVLGVFGGCVALFIANKPRMDVVALIALVLLPLTGVITAGEAVAGFGDSIILLIAALFVVGEALVRTGVAFRLSDLLVRYAGSSETRLIILLMLAVAVLGSIMSSTGVVAIFIPVALTIAKRQGIAPGRLMMPMSFAGLISGMLTLVGTAPNLVVDSALKHHGHAGLGFFSLTPIGVVILALAIGYMVVMRGRLSKTESSIVVAAVERNFPVLIHDYRLADRELRLRVREGSPLTGRSLEVLNLRRTHGFNLVAVERPARLGTEMVLPGPATELQAGDTLLVDRLACETAPPKTHQELGLDLLPLSGSYFSDQSRKVGMAEVVIAPESALIGSTVRDTGLRREYGLQVLGLRRDRQALDGPVIDEKLRASDTLLVIGTWKAIRRLQGQRREFLVLSLPPESTEDAPAADRAPYALLSLGLMVVLMITGWVPNVVAALIACLLLGLFRCISMDVAYRCIHWKSLVLIAGMIPFASALERTGGINLAVNGLMAALEGAGPRVYLAALFGVTAVIGLFISNTVTALLMAPIALGMAQHLGVSPFPFAITVALAASTAFMTPISSPVNTLVVEPGNYRFGDFVKMGVPFSLIVLLVTVLMVPLLFPF